uniref:Uncharacterized protein n=1 Tax=viral metagenome TaxID=1070528 RepID=A0A6C0DY41_9ZZZZ
MKRVISFSLWGDKPTYNIGAIKNAEDALIMYPGFECWFYINKESVPEITVTELTRISNTKIIYKEGDLNTVKPRMWRFEAIDDPNVEVMLSRDTDSRFRIREILAVTEWINSDKLFHIMRDHHRHHSAILAGMFGTKKNPNIPGWMNIMTVFNQGGERYTYDQYFLKKYIYPIIKTSVMVHATFYRYEPGSKPFPIDYDSEFRFVGENVFHDSSSPQDYKEMLKEGLNSETVEIFVEKCIDNPLGKKYKVILVDSEKHFLAILTSNTKPYDFSKILHLPKGSRYSHVILYLNYNKGIILIIIYL